MSAYTPSKKTLKYRVHHVSVTCEVSIFGLIRHMTYHLWICECVLLESLGYCCCRPLTCLGKSRQMSGLQQQYTT